MAAVTLNMNIIRDYAKEALGQIDVKAASKAQKSIDELNKLKDQLASIMGPTFISNTFALSVGVVKGMFKKNIEHAVVFTESEIYELSNFGFKNIYNIPYNDLKSVKRNGNTLIFLRRCGVVHEKSYEHAEFIEAVTKKIINYANVIIDKEKKLLSEARQKEIDQKRKETEESARNCFKNNKIVATYMPVGFTVEQDNKLRQIVKDSGGVVFSKSFIKSVVSEAEYASYEEFLKDASPVIFLPDKDAFINAYEQIIRSGLSFNPKVMVNGRVIDPTEM